MFLKKAHSGFALVSAIFILVVLSLLGTFLVKIFLLGSETLLFATQGVRAYSAAQSAFDWGGYQAVINNSCSASTTITMTQSALNGFSAVVQCSSVATTEGTLYTITVKSSKGTLGTLDYVSRTISGVVVK